jgi:hypothetical protein
MGVLSEATLKSFEDRMVIHLNKCFPSQCKAWGEPAVRDTIRYGVERAATHDITSKREVCKYIDLMVVFGRDFDQDPTLPWASSILGDRTLRGSTVKLERLYETAKQQSRNGDAIDGGF